MSAGLAAGLSVSIFLLVVIAVLLVIFFVLWKKNKDREEAIGNSEYKRSLVKSEVKYNRYTRKKGVDMNSDSDSDYEDDDSDSDYEDDYEDSDYEEGEGSGGSRRKGGSKEGT